MAKGSKEETANRGKTGRQGTLRGRKVSIIQQLSQVTSKKMILREAYSV